MRASNLLKWKRTLNELRFKHSELEFIEDINESTSIQLLTETKSEDSILILLNELLLELKELNEQKKNRIFRKKIN